MVWDEKKLDVFIRDLWGSFLKLDSKGLIRVESFLISPPAITGRVDFSGAWNGTLLVSCGEPLLRKIAKAMLEKEEGALDHVELHDTAGELANIIGGHVKHFLPFPSLLSLPIVERGSVLPIKLSLAQMTCRAAYLSENELLLLTLVRIDAGIGR